jgi:hypothetical protein
VPSDGGERGCRQERGHGGQQVPGERSSVRLDRLDDRFGVRRAEPHPPGRSGQGSVRGWRCEQERCGLGRFDRRRRRDQRNRRIRNHGTSHRPRLGAGDAGLRPQRPRMQLRALGHRPRRRNERRDGPQPRRRNRSGSRRRCRNRRGRRRSCRRLAWGRRCRQRREEAERVEIALRVAAEPDAELQVRHRVGRHPARADERDRLALDHHRAPGDQERTEMQESDGVAVAGLDRDREPVGRDLADEGHGTGSRSDHSVAESSLKVDPAVLPWEERVALVEGEPLQHRTRNRPRPGAGRRRRHERHEQCDGRDPDEARFPLPVLQTTGTVPGRPIRCQIGLQ